MRRTINSDDVTKLESLRQRIERWRSLRKKRTRMPHELWDEAVARARVHGVWETAQVLTVNYASLRDHLAAAGSVSSRQRTRFVELERLPMAETSAQLKVEVQRRDGSRLSVHLPQADSSALVSLLDHFLRAVS